MENKLYMLDQAIKTLQRAKDEYGNIPILFYDPESSLPFSALKSINVGVLSKDDDGDHKEKCVIMSNIVLSEGGLE